MRYIEKHFDTAAVQQYKQELNSLQLDERSLSDAQVHPGKTGRQIYDMVRDMDAFRALKVQMYHEQGGVCCYCGMKLEYPFNLQYRVEHVLPKESHRELAGEYKNLLLSCRANKEEHELRENAASKSERKGFIHCDEAKGAKEITYSPLDKSCEGVFWYDLRGAVHSNNPETQKDIKTLGLDGAYLTSRRKEAIDSLFIDDDVLLSEDYLRAYRDGLCTPGADGKLTEFYFVLIDAINQLLPNN